MVAGRVGDDAAGRMLLAHLAAHGVRAEVGIDATSRTGTVLVVDGEIRADRGANSAVRAGAPAAARSRGRARVRSPAGTDGGSRARTRESDVGGAGRSSPEPRFRPRYRSCSPTRLRPGGSQASVPRRRFGSWHTDAGSRASPSARTGRSPPGTVSSTAPPRRRRKRTSTQPARATRSRPHCWSSWRAVRESRTRSPPRATPARPSLRPSLGPVAVQACVEAR